VDDTSSQSSVETEESIIVNKLDHQLQFLYDNVEGIEVFFFFFFFFFFFLYIYQIIFNKIYIFILIFIIYLNIINYIIIYSIFNNDK